jgi:hypothetical protein
MKSLVKGLLGLATLVGLVAVGGFVLRKRVPSFGTPDDSRVAVAAVFDGVDFVSTSDNLENLVATAYLGGIKVDLTAATPAPGATINLRACMGGIDLIVPTTWRVEMTSSGSMSGVANLTNPDLPADGPLVIVDVCAFAGGIEIHERGAGHGR